MRVRNLTAWYGKHTAIQDVSLDIPNQGVTAIIGRPDVGRAP
jgi:ABC-type phosphate transport system ATPase subunit